MRHGFESNRIIDAAVLVIWQSSRSCGEIMCPIMTDGCSCKGKMGLVENARGR
jgi:hypothetical protein